MTIVLPSISEFLRVPVTALRNGERCPVAVSEVRGKTFCFLRIGRRGFPGGAVVENPPANAGDTGSIPGPGRSHMLRSN